MWRFLIMNRKDLEKQILINFENDELKENIMQCVDAYANAERKKYKQSEDKPKKNELEIYIYNLNQKKIELENKITDFSRYGRSPDDSEFQQMFDYLKERDRLINKIEALQICLDAVIENVNIKSNKK